MLSRKILNRIIDQNPHPIWISDEKGTLVQTNRALKVFLNVTDEQIIGKYNVLEDPVVEAWGLLPKFRAVYEEGATADFEIEWDGSLIPHLDLGDTNVVHIEGTLYPIYDDQGKLTNAAITYRDVSPRKLVDLELRKHRDHLEELVEERTAEVVESERRLRQSHAELQRFNEELKQFAYVASHDLQEPLRMISSFLQLLQKQYQEKIDATADEYIHFAVDAAARMRRLINDLLRLSRVGQKGVPMEPVSFEEILVSAKQNISLSIEETGAQISHGELPVVLGDKTQLVQLLQNLLGNALKFRREEAPRVHLSAARDGPRWRFQVEDNGIGLDEADAKKIFVVFKRLHHAEEYEGTGIGLAICKKITELHGGRIWVEGVPGKGSSFFFTLRGAEG